MDDYYAPAYHHHHNGGPATGRKPRTKKAKAKRPGYGVPADPTDDFWSPMRPPYDDDGSYQPNDGPAIAASVWPSPSRQQGGYGARAQQGSYGTQQGGYGAQQGGYGAQRSPYAAQHGSYGAQAQQGPYGAQQGSDGAQAQQPPPSWTPHGARAAAPQQPAAAGRGYGYGYSDGEYEYSPPGAAAAGGSVGRPWAGAARLEAERDQLVAQAEVQEWRQKAQAAQEQCTSLRAALEVAQAEARAARAEGARLQAAAAAWTQAAQAARAAAARLRGEEGSLRGVGPEQMAGLEGEIEAGLKAVRRAAAAADKREAARGAREAALECGVCMSAPRGMVLGCGHLLCEGCSGQVAECPFCRKRVTVRVKIFDT